MEISNFIQTVASGDALKAKEILNDVLSARAFESIDAQKQELAKRIFGGAPEEIEVQDTADTEIEHEDEELLTQEEFDALSEEDQEMYLEALEQLDEIGNTPEGKAALGRYVQKRVKQIPNVEVRYQMTPDEDGPFGAKRIKKFQRKINKGVTGALNRLSGTNVTKKPAK